MLVWKFVQEHFCEMELRLIVLDGADEKIADGTPPLATKAACFNHIESIASDSSDGGPRIAIYNSQS